MDPESSTDATPSRSRAVTLLVWFLVLVLIGYPLSIGPVMASLPASSRRNEPKWFSQLYAPLGYAYANVPAVRPFYRWYLALWVTPPY